MTVEDGTIWTLNESGVRLCGGEIKLDNEETLEWIEISKEHLTEYFTVQN